MIADSDWPLDSLQAHHGASMAYRVTRKQEKVRVEGREGLRTCLIETPDPTRAARMILGAGAANRLLLH
jgi:regulation of enolase protein 1 (concanavalin A-like superfamily)